MMAVSPFVILDLPFSVHVTSICIPSFCLYVMSKLFLGIRLGRNGFAVLSSESFLIEVDKILIEAIFSESSLNIFIQTLCLTCVMTRLIICDVGLLYT
jgi:hypothetical protein